MYTVSLNDKFWLSGKLSFAQYLTDPSITDKWGFNIFWIHFRKSYLIGIDCVLAFLCQLWKEINDQQWLTDSDMQTGWQRKGSGSNESEAGAESLKLRESRWGSRPQANYTTRLLEINKKPGLYGKEIKPSVFGENSFEKDSKQLAKLWPRGDLLCGRRSAKYFSGGSAALLTHKWWPRSNPSSLTSLWGWRWWEPDNSSEAS